MRDWRKRHGEYSLASEQNGVESPSPWIVSMITREMNPTATVVTSASAEATDYVSSTTSQHSHDYYGSTGRPWVGPTTMITATKIPYGGGFTPIILILPSPSGWDVDNTLNSQGSEHPGFIAAPIIGFAIIVGLLFLCFRSRRRQRGTVAAQTNAQEMTTQPQRSVQPYIAPQLETSTHFTTSPAYSSPSSNPVSPPPVILGPILTGADSSYLTGIDTSEDAPISLGDRPTDPFADNQSITEPPPPYRPRSVALPSFAAARQGHLVERSPFDDPPNDADAVSEISEPAGGREEDALSDVSDLSHQQEPNVSRTTH